LSFQPHNDGINGYFRATWKAPCFHVMIIQLVRCVSYGINKQK